MLDRLFIAISRFAFAELTRHIREEKKAAAIAFASEQRRRSFERRALDATKLAAGR